VVSLESLLFSSFNLPDVYGFSLGGLWVWVDELVNCLDLDWSETG